MQIHPSAAIAALFFGSSRNPRACCLDLEEKMAGIATIVGRALDDLDAMVDPHQLSGVRGATNPGDNPAPVGLERGAIASNACAPVTTVRISEALELLFHHLHCHPWRVCGKRVIQRLGVRQRPQRYLEVPIRDQMVKYPKSGPPVPPACIFVH